MSAVPPNQGLDPQLTRTRNVNVDYVECKEFELSTPLKILAWSLAVIAFCVALLTLMRLLDHFIGNETKVESFNRTEAKSQHMLSGKHDVWVACGNGYRVIISDDAIATVADPVCK